MQMGPLANYCLFLMGFFLPFILSYVNFYRHYHTYRYLDDFDDNYNYSDHNDKISDAFITFIFATGAVLLHKELIAAGVGLMLSGQVFVYRDSYNLKQNLVLLLPFLLAVGLTHVTDSIYFKLFFLLFSSTTTGIFLYFVNRADVADDD